MKEENPNALKHLIGERVVKKYFSRMDVPSSRIREINRQLLAIELKPRIRLIAHELGRALPKDYPRALKELLQITRTQDLKSFEFWPATEFIQLYGLDHPEESLEAMYELTPKFTSEFCIRPFINRYGREIYERLSRWQADPDEHIRRWISEGTRPRLPWGERLKAAVVDPSPGLELLENLKYDSSLYVRKSVANHLNDIAKDHPAKVVQTLKRWRKDSPETYGKEFQFIVHRALRTLVKDGHPEALALMGVKSSKDLFRASPVRLDKAKIRMNEAITFNFTLQNKGTKSQSFIIDYVIYFKKANGALSPKVFKLKKVTLKKGEKIKIEKRHAFKPITTRVFRPGTHKLAVKVNGLEQKSAPFELK